ncbi:4692_t:CDS:1, partial [Funneliformis geosporum]
AYQDIEDEDLFKGEDSSEEEGEMIILGLTLLLEIRYFEQRTHVIKSKNWRCNILPNYDDIRFKKIMRMDSINFQKLISVLNPLPIFQNNSNNLQASVELQLAVFLKRIGSKENIFEISS